MNQQTVQKLRSVYDKMSAAGVILLGTLPTRLFTFVFGELYLHVHPTPQGVAHFVLFCTNPAHGLGPGFLEAFFNMRASREQLGSGDPCVVWRVADEDDLTISLGDWMHENGYRRRNRLKEMVREKLVAEQVEGRELRPPSMMSNPGTRSYEEIARGAVAEDFPDERLDELTAIYERMLDETGMVPDGEMSEHLLSDARRELSGKKAS